MITRFENEYAFLSNFFATPVEFDGTLYPSSEHAFQAAKSMDPCIRDKIRNASTSGAAKYLGRHIKLREDWEIVKDDIMYEIVRDKFTRNEELRDLLKATEKEMLIEGNDWGDKYWGAEILKDNIINGKNQLGKILMKVREEI